jgi:MFS family permease
MKMTEVSESRAAKAGCLREAISRASQAGDSRHGLRRVIVASSLGAIFESYDLVLYGPLAAIIAKQFFSALDEVSAYIFTLLSFALGYLVRPFGAVIFGRLGDRVGRKYSFLITIVIMGISTTFIGLLPSYAVIGVAAPALLMGLRLLQGLAFGGEFGGAVTYIAEYAGDAHRGLATSAVGITSACGLILSVLVVLACEVSMGKAPFEAWGWRIPFLLSVVLMLVSAYIRRRLQESPLFVQLKQEGGIAKEPLKEAFGNGRHLRTALLLLFGVVAGSSVALATGAYPIYLLMLNLKIDPFLLHYTILGSSTLFVFFMIGSGWLSDRIGRKPVMLTGFALTAAMCFPIFSAISHYASPALEAAIQTSPVTVRAYPRECSRQFDPIGIASAGSSCDIARKAIAKAGVPYANETTTAGVDATITIGALQLTAFDGRSLDKATAGRRSAAFSKELDTALADAGYPARADPKQTNVSALIVLMSLLYASVALASAPLAAWAVELFPTSVRDTALSVPYHIGGWFGGFFPAIAFSAFAVTGNLYAGLWYSIVVLLLSFVVSGLLLPETRGRSLIAVE